MAIKFKFSIPGKSKDAPKDEDKAEAKPEAKEPEETGDYSKADLGKMLASAIKSGDGEAIWEALQKNKNCTPTDADE